MKDLPKTWILTENQFEDFRRKKTETIFLTFQKKTQWKTKNPTVSIDHGPRKQ